jgi:TATA-box binding protein (TBP) (component of TFIID and TFIIIB)
MDYDEFIECYPKFLELDPDISEDIQISTMTIVCKVPCSFNVINIAKYIELSNDFILSVKCGNTNEIYRSLIPMKNKKKNTDIRKNFYNQTTMIIKTKSTDRINIKLFRNGAIQLTGCKCISVPMWILSKLFTVLKIPKIINENDSTMEITYVTCYQFLNIENIINFKIAMINSNFDIGFYINREKLFNMLTNDKYDCIYEPSRHAGVNLRYSTKYSVDCIKPVSIFIFDKGTIIITGARNYRQLLECYKFINTYLLENYTNIVRTDIKELTS